MAQKYRSDTKTNNLQMHKSRSEQAPESVFQPRDESEEEKILLIFWDLFGAI